MDKNELNKILEDLNKTSDRNMVIVDYGNLQKWEEIKNPPEGEF